VNWKKLVVVATAGTALLGASSAFANPPNWAPAYGWHAKRHHHYQSRPVVIYAPAPVYYYPPQRPVIYGHVPVTPALRIGFGIRL
jgi:hypothetical protein